MTDTGGLVVTTKGADGCVIYTPEGEIYHSLACKVKPVDTTGAGNTFNASFVYGLSEGWDIQTVGAFANAAAGRAILSIGARSGAVGENAVKEFMEKEETDK